jgi:hypothetical protein
LVNRQICSYYTSESPKSSSARSAEKDRLLKRVDVILGRYSDAFKTPHFCEKEFEDAFDPVASSFEELDAENDMLHKGDLLVRDVLLTHAYVKTVFLALIQRSWVYGVLSSAELLWAKTVDRELFYVLSQQGRFSAFVEVSGAWSHYLAESTYGFKVLPPQLSQGVRAFDFDLWQTHSNYAPHEEWEDVGRYDKLVPDSKMGAGLQQVGPKARTADLI